MELFDMPQLSKKKTQYPNESTTGVIEKTGFLFMQQTFIHSII